jgi:hypothetical protein
MSDDITVAPAQPVRGTPQSAAWFRAMLAELGETQASMARLMKRKGDDRNPETIARHMRRMATGEARVSGEMRVILTMMLRAKSRSEKRLADKVGDEKPSFLAKSTKAARTRTPVSRSGDRPEH